MVKSEAWGWVLAAMCTSFFFYGLIPLILSIIGLKKCTDDEPDKTLKIFAYVILGVSIFRLIVTIAVLAFFVLVVLSAPTHF